MAIADDFSTNISGDIRYTGSGTNYTMLEFRDYLAALADDEQASGDDLIDITTDTPYSRSTDQILSLNSPFNIDDTVAEHLYDGSLSWNSGEDQISGLYLVGALETGTEPIIVQDNKVLAPYWSTGINSDAATIMKICVRTRRDGADIDGKRIKVLAREINDTFAEFSVTLGEANSTAALFTGDDVFHDKSSATLEGYFGTIVNTEGWQEIDIDGTGATGQEYYSQWDTGGQVVNDVYEYTKWIQKRSESADSNAETGNDLTVDDATTTGIGAEFTARDNAQKLVEARLKLKSNGTPTGDMYCELYDSDDATPPLPTGAALATSESLDVNRLTTTYAETIFRFNDNVTLTADQTYFIVIQHPDGSASNYIIAEGDTSTADDGSYAYYQTASWNGTATTQLWFNVKSSPVIHSIAGELFRGISVQVDYDGETGTFSENETVGWGTRVVYDTLTGGFTAGDYVIFENGGTQVNAGKILYDNGSTEMLVALEDITGSTLADGYDILDAAAPTTNYAAINATIEDQDKGGGEGLLIALDDDGLTGQLYMQVLTGVNPAIDILMRGLTSGATAEPTATTSRTIKPEFVGQSTGSNIIGSYGIGFDKDDVGSSDLFTDLANGSRQPPNNVTFTVAGLVASEYRVLVGPRAAGVLDKDQYTLDTTLNSSGQIAVKVSPDIQTETPTSGTGTDNTRLRVQLDTGVYRRVAFTGWGTVADEFVTASTDWTDPLDATAGNDVFVAYIDVLADGTEEAFTAVHATNRDLLIRVRDGGTTNSTPMKPQDSSATFTSASTTVTVSLVQDY